MSTLRAPIEKCSQFAFSLSSAATVISAFRNKRLSSNLVCTLLHGGGAFGLTVRLVVYWALWTMATEQLSDQLRVVMERQAPLENALMQERQARAEAEQRLNVALGEVGGRGDAAVATASAGTASTLMGAGSNSAMGCIDTRLLGKPDKFDGQDSCWRDWKFITKAYIQAALPDTRALLLMAEETTDDVRNAALTAPQQGLSSASSSSTCLLS